MEKDNGKSRVPKNTYIKKCIQFIYVSYRWLILMTFLILITDKQGQKNYKF